MVIQNRLLHLNCKLGTFVELKFLAELLFQLIQFLIFISSLIFRCIGSCKHGKPVFRISGRSLHICHGIDIPRCRILHNTVVVSRTVDIHIDSDIF